MKKTRSTRFRTSHKSTVSNPVPKERRACTIYCAIYCEPVMLDEIRRLLKAPVYIPIVVTTIDGNARPIQSPELVLIGKYLTIQDLNGLVEVIHPKAISSISVKEEGYTPA